MTFQLKKYAEYLIIDLLSTSRSKSFKCTITDGYYFMRNGIFIYIYIS